jgi:hypothetical protein
MTDDDIERGLAVLFVYVWGAFIEGVGIDQADLEGVLEKTGLAEFRAATAIEAAAMGDEYEPGDTILALTEDGKRVRDAGQP